MIMGVGLPYRKAGKQWEAKAKKGEITWRLLVKVAVSYFSRNLVQRKSFGLIREVVFKLDRIPFLSLYELAKKS